MAASLRVSLALLAVAAFAFVGSHAVDPWKHRISLTDDFHVTLWGHVVDARIVFFNDAEYGPYRGSIIGLAGDSDLKERGFGDFLGIYYRHFQWPNSVLWTWMVSLWYPVALFGTCSFVTWLRSSHERRVSQ